LQFVNSEPGHTSLVTPSQQGWPTAEDVDGVSDGPVRLVGMADAAFIMYAALAMASACCIMGVNNF